jgi:hypothetical protein
MSDRPHIVSEVEAVLKESQTAMRTVEVWRAVRARGNWPELGAGATSAALYFLYEKKRISRTEVSTNGGYTVGYWSA